MTIKITPEDLLKRGLWDMYSNYIMPKTVNPEIIIQENKEFEISEQDALVVGLIKVIETENLIFKFNDYISFIINNRAIKDYANLLVSKTLVYKSMDKFLLKFPDYWKPSIVWVNAIKDVEKYIEDFKNKIEKGDGKKQKPLKIIEITKQNIKSEYYNVNNIKKLLCFNNY
jgi:hypothetical protein